MLLALFLVYEEHVRPPLGPVLVAVGVGVLFVATTRHSRRSPRPACPSSRRPRPRALGVVAFVCTSAHFVLVYAVPSMGMPWPAGLAVALAPLGAGTLAVRHWATTGPLGIDGFWMVAGILSFFVLLDALVGLGGRYDLTLGAILTALALARLRRRFPHAHPRRRRPALLPGRARVAPPPGMNGRGEDLDRRRIDWEKRLQL